MLFPNPYACTDFFAKDYLNHRPRLFHPSCWRLFSFGRRAGLLAGAHCHTFVISLFAGAWVFRVAGLSFGRKKAFHRLVRYQIRNYLFVCFLFFLRFALSGFLKFHLFFEYHFLEFKSFYINKCHQLLSQMQTKMTLSKTLTYPSS